MKKLIYIAIALMAFVSCSKLDWKVYDHPYVYVKYANDLSLSETSSVPAMSNNVERKYDFCLSSKRQEKPITVTYEIVVGDGLTSGVDYELLDEGDSIVFEPGEFMKSISIKFLRRKVDKAMDNSITIRITGADIDISLGIPGAEPKNAFHTIKKKN